MNNIADELRNVRQGFRSLEKMAEALRPYPGFENLSAATISRWLKNPSKRAIIALQILNSETPSIPLRIAEPQSLLVLPSTMLGWNSEKGKQYGLLEKRYGIQAKIKTVKTGNEALQLLREGQVEVALAAPELLDLCGPDCHQLCSLSQAHLIGVTKKRVGSVFDLKGLRIGVPEGSAVGLKLSELCRYWGTMPPSIRGFQDVPDFIQALKDDAIDGVVAWEPLISRVRREAPELLPIRRELLGSLEIVVVVNVRVANPSAIRTYLLALQETAADVQKRKAIPAFHSEIAEYLRMDKQEVKNVLEDSEFYSEDSGLVKIKPLLALWEREVSSQG